MTPFAVTMASNKDKLLRFFVTVLPGAVLLLLELFCNFSLFYPNRIQYRRRKFHFYHFKSILMINISRTVIVLTLTSSVFIYASFYLLFALSTPTVFTCLRVFLILRSIYLKDGGRVLELDRRSSFDTAQVIKHISPTTDLPFSNSHQVIKILRCVLILHRA